MFFSRRRRAGGALSPSLLFLVPTSNAGVAKRADGRGFRYAYTYELVGRVDGDGWDAGGASVGVGGSDGAGLR